MCESSIPARFAGSHADPPRRLEEHVRRRLAAPDLLGRHPRPEHPSQPDVAITRLDHLAVRGRGERERPARGDPLHGRLGAGQQRQPLRVASRARARRRGRRSPAGRAGPPARRARSATTPASSCRASPRSRRRASPGPCSATSALRPPSQADSESSRRPSRSKMTARIKRGTRESNPNLRFWRPPSLPLDQSPGRTSTLGADRSSLAHPLEPRRPPRDQPDARAGSPRPPATVERWIASSRNSAPHSTPNTGTTKITVIPPVGAELRDQAEVQEVGERGRGEREREQARAGRPRPAPRAPATAGSAGAARRVAASCWPIASASGGSSAKRTRITFAPTP